MKPILGQIFFINIQRDTLFRRRLSFDYYGADPWSTVNIQRDIYFEE